MDSETVIFNKEKITIGSNINGYGNHIDKKQVYLTNGQKTLVPTIKAECIEIE